MDNAETFSTKLTESLTEEQGDAEKYLAMADMAQEMWPTCGYDAILRDIAKEEMLHRRHLQSIEMDMKKHEKKEQE